MKLQVKNTASSVLVTVTGIISGMILPREILLRYGTEMNGMVQSVTRFLQFTVILELGLGAVIPSALYPPLAQKNYSQISAILTSAYRSYRRIALILVGYILLLILLFPLMTGNVYPWEVSAWMIVCVGIGSVASHWAGTPDRLLLVADQKGYIPSLLTICTTVLNTGISILLIRSGASLAIVKLVGSGMTVLSICFICSYVSGHYPVSRHVKHDGEPIPQKWNGIAQHIAFIVLEYTDVLLLTVMMTFREVSVYSVYYMVIVSVKHLFTSATYSVQPKLGELWAKGEAEPLNRFFSFFECITHLAVVCLFTCTGLLLVPFIRIYTAGVEDAQYIQPVFAAVMVLAQGFQCLRDPYDKMILASGHFRQTQNNYIIAACLNIGLSVLFVRIWGLTGVAVGTLAAMVYQAGYMVRYDSRVLLRRPLRISLRQLVIDLVTAGAILLSASLIRLQPGNFLAWCGLAALVTAIAAGITLAAAFLFCRGTLASAGFSLRRPFRR